MKIKNFKSKMKNFFLKGCTNGIMDPEKKKEESKKIKWFELSFIV